MAAEPEQSGEQDPAYRRLVTHTSAWVDFILRSMAKRESAGCAVTRGAVDLHHYESLDQEWRQARISAPARRALIDHKLYKVSDLHKISLAELAKLHGIGKSTLARLKHLVEASKIP